MIRTETFLLLLAMVAGDGCLSTFSTQQVEGWTETDRIDEETHALRQELLEALQPEAPKRACVCWPLR